MSEIVFILGAGASKEAGAPLMKDFLSRADQLRRAGRTGPYAADFKRVDNAINELTRVHSKAQLNLDDLEEVFGAFEMARVIERFPGLQTADASGAAEIEALLRSFRNVITATLEESINYPFENTELKAPASYANFAGLLRRFQKPGERTRCAVITFNYDVALDLALYRAGIGIDYGLTASSDPNAMPYLKLHGSLNWFPTVSAPTKIKPWYFGDFFRPLRSYEATPNPTQLRLSQHIAREQPFANEQVDSTPVIVPPTWNKTAYQAAIASVWSRAAAELSNTEQVFVCGYSLIATDAYFKYLFALGSVGQSRIRTFAVYDPDAAVEERFGKLLGPGIRGFHFATSPFSGFVELLDEQFGKSATA